MALPRRYLLANDADTLATLDDIANRGLASEFWALYGELQFSPRDRGLGIRGFRDAPDSYTAWNNPLLLYRVHEDPPLIALIGLADIL